MEGLGGGSGSGGSLRRDSKVPGSSKITVLTRREVAQEGAKGFAVCVCACVTAAREDGRGGGDDEEGGKRP
eukprot:3164282-Rhodomonas_salina.1